MKKLFVVLAVVGLGAGLSLLLARHGSPRVASPAPPQEIAALAEVAVAAASAGPVAAKAAPAASPEAMNTTSPLTAQAPAAQAGESVSPVVDQAIQALLSPRSGFQQRQALWHQLKQAGHLDRAISTLERQMSAQPQAAECPAVLGQAYLQKAGSIQDVREQGILGMKADQTFDAALALDPDNWEARFWKATAMSYWPSMLGKDTEVAQHCVTLIEQQEAQQSQPHYAQTYVLLGDQYRKLGHPEYAQQIWQRGSSLFPADAALQERLAANR
jgi:tetratricopeptide (TPR) repeat protein